MKQKTKPVDTSSVSSLSSLSSVSSMSSVGNSLVLNMEKLFGTSTSLVMRRSNKLEPSSSSSSPIPSEQSLFYEVPKNGIKSLNELFLFKRVLEKLRYIETEQYQGKLKLNDEKQQQKHHVFTKNEVNEQWQQFTDAQIKETLDCIRFERFKPESMPDEKKSQVGIRQVGLRPARPAPSANENDVWYTGFEDIFGFATFFCLAFWDVPMLRTMWKSMKLLELVKILCYYTMNLGSKYDPIRTDIQARLLNGGYLNYTDLTNDSQRTKFLIDVLLHVMVLTESESPHDQQEEKFKSAKPLPRLILRSEVVTQEPRLIFWPSNIIFIKSITLVVNIYEYLTEIIKDKELLKQEFRSIDISQEFLLTYRMQTLLIQEPITEKQFIVRITLFPDVRYDVYRIDKDLPYLQEDLWRRFVGVSHLGDNVEYEILYFSLVKSTPEERLKVLQLQQRDASRR